MANYLASIFGTEQDKVNCSFYYKIGACRHGDRCSRKHVKPSYSQTILLPNLYQNPAYDPKNKMNASQLQNHFDAFYEDFWCEMCKYGEIEEVVVCDNNNDRMSPPSPHHTRCWSTREKLTQLPNRSDRQRLRALQVRRQRAKGVRRPQQPLVRRAPHLLRAVARHGLPRGLLPPEFRRGLRARRLLQLHPSQEP
jgi:hypothetical protein